MDKGKKIEVSSSTLVDLKAELYRKQEELKRNKGRQDTTVRTGLKLGQKIRSQVDQLGKSNPGLATRLAKDRESQYIENSEDQDALAASRRKLEEKAKLYEKMMGGVDIPNEEEECYMVDFQRKQLENLNKAIDPTKNKQLIEESDMSKAKSKDEEWIDYTDCLGRSRRCLRTDLPKMIAMDQDLQSRKVEDSGSESPLYAGESNEQREEVEEDMEAEAAPIGPVHYQNVQFNEIRSHGVGYFAFSQSEEERKQQLDALNQLRNQTKEQRTRMEKLKEKRQSALKARLEKVKQRKRLKTGEVLSESDSDKSDVEDEKTPNQELPAIPPVESHVKKVEQPAAVRPWDRGKIGVNRMIQPFRKASQKEWVERRREERPTEFAPPQSYYQRNPVEEMHAFFKEQQAKHSQMPNHQPPSFNSESQFFNQNGTSSDTVDNIPLPPHGTNT